MVLFALLIDLTEVDRFDAILSTFQDIIGDIAIAKDFGDAITSSNSGAEPTPEDPEKKKRREEEHEARVARLAGKLSERLDVYSDGFAFTDSEEPDKEAEREALRKFREKFKAEANELRKENFGVELLHALGFTYRLKAGQNLAKIDAESGHLGKKIWGMGARFWGGIREKKQVISETFSTVKTAYELQSSFTKLQELEDRRKARENGDELPPPKKGPALSAEEEAELSRKLEQEAATKGMEALWMGSKLEVQSVIREVCDVVLAEEVERERRRRRCIALDALGEVYESVRPE